MSCPLCRAKASRSVGSLDLTVALNAMGIRSAVDAVASRPVDRVDLLECNDCDLQFFSPGVVGNSNLYTELAEGSYYQPLRWDQRVALAHVHPDARVLDVGCGNGTFVGNAAKVGAQAVGLDFVPPPASFPHEQASHIRAEAELDDKVFADIANRFGVFDLVTAFQLLEHVGDPLKLVERAAQLVRPGGLLVVSVPNRKRFEIDPVQALDCPPHHQTRWTTRSLRALGQQAGLPVVELRVQRTANPLRIANRLLRRAAHRHNEDWPLPPAAGPWPPWRVFNGMSLVAAFRPTPLSTGEAPTARRGCPLRRTS